MAKKFSFRAGYIDAGTKILIVVPKNYHKDIRKMNKPIEVSVEDLDLE